MSISIILRSIIFNTIFFLTLSFFLILGSVLYFFDRKYIFMFWHYLSIILDFLSTKVGGITHSVENEENILNKPAIYATRHESAWETLILIHKFKEPIFVLKKELLNIPIFGMLSRKSGAIEIDRNNKARALIDAARRIEDAIKDGHPVIIFPEGTRISTGKHAKLNRGISFFYKRSNCPVVPVIHDSGKFWPRQSFLKKPGSISVIFSEPIAPGLSQDEFMEKLSNSFHNGIEKLKNKKEANVIRTYVR